MTDAFYSDKFFHIYSCDLDVNIQIKIGTLEGKRERPGYRELISDPLLRFSGICQESISDLYVTCQVFADGRTLVLPVQTSYKAFTKRWNWNEWLTLPIKYSDLPRDAQLAFTIWDIYGPNKPMLVGGTTISVFGKHGLLRQGMHDLKVWLGVEADGNSPGTTPGKASGQADEMSRIAKLSKRHRNGHLPKVDWLDRLTFREIEIINEQQKQHSNFLYLMIEFPRIQLGETEYSVYYFEKDADIVRNFPMHGEIIHVPDPEMQLENLVESKHHKLARSLRSGPTDRDLKPNAATRDQLNFIVGYPQTKLLTSEEKDLIWKFRFYLSTQKKALTKFLKSVNWKVVQEAKQALDLLNKWSPMDVDDALELLSSAFINPAAVRKYAVTRLQQADDEDLLLYLLQLVQALKYENFTEIDEAHDREKSSAGTRFLSSHPSTPSRQESNVSVRSTDTAAEREVVGVVGVVTDPPLQESISDTQTLLEALEENVEGNIADTYSDMDLATFLISRACNNSVLANYFYWYLKVEIDDQQDIQSKDVQIMNMYKAVFDRFSLALRRGNAEWRRRLAALGAQKQFLFKIIELVKIVSREGGNRKRKIEKLQSVLSDAETLKFNFSSFDSIPLPLDPDIRIKGIIPGSATLFKSALMPCRFTFCTDDNNKEYVAIFKHGDDLRQDQLVLQIITLMDRLLRKENLDLKLTPYKVLATSSKHGFVQFIESVSVAEVLATDGSIQTYFRRHAPSDNAPYGIAPEAMDNYIKSCAGYSVITYILGVGDRHLDNLLLTKTGKLFHIDFGYILGRDPKPLPPPMKLCKEMIDAMGGPGSEHFADFKRLCYTAFLHLRRSANLILNLFSLMVDANVPDIALEPDKTVKKVQDKFRLDLTDEQAVQYMQNLIDVSMSATIASLVEQMHKFAQYWRK
jgi:phosphatidylinositol 3-kinase